MKTITSSVAALAMLVAVALGIGLLSACSGGGKGSSATPTLTLALTPLPTLTPRPATAQEVELIHNTITTTRQLKTVHTTEMRMGSTYLESYVDLAAGNSYMTGEVLGKHIERLYLNGVSYKKDPSAQWVEFTGPDEDLSGLQEIMSIGGSFVAFIQYNKVMNTQAPEMMDGVQVEHFTWYSGDTKFDIWVDAGTGYEHKLTWCGSSSVFERESCTVITQNRQNEPFDIVKLAGGVIATPVPPTPTTASVWNTERAASLVCGEWRYMLGGSSDNLLYGIAGAAAIGGKEVWAAISQSPSASLLRWTSEGWGDTMAVQDKGQLSALAAISDSDVWAVGYAQDEKLDRHSLTAHWDGKEWQVVPSPDSGSRTNLLDVFGFSSDDVWAVGTGGTIVELETLTMHWDGKAWSIVPSPNPGSFQGDPLTTLHAMSGAAGDDAWAVGEYEDADQHRAALTMHWDGTSWRKVALPAGENIPMLNMVTALSAKDVWAAGGPGEGNPGPGVLLHWDGQTWSNVPVPGPEPIRFEAIVPLSPGRVWFGGTVNQSSKAYVALFTEGQCSGK